jgi:putative membrane protein
MSILFAALVAVIHAYVFFLESLAWGRPRTNKLFRVSESDAEKLRKFAFNQGFYNLFLAIEIFGGLGLRFAGHGLEGNALVDFGALSVFGAGVVLFASDTSLKRPALIQALPALGYLGFRLLGY